MSDFPKKINLTETQKGIYFDCQIDDPISYNLSATFILENFEEKYFENALKLLVSEQEMLRSSVEVINDLPVILIHENVEFQLIKQDILGCESTKKEELQRIIEEEVLKPFKLSNAPLFRCKLLKVGDNRHLFLICIHHIISDGLSLNILIKKLVEFYQKLLKKKNFVLKKDEGFSRFVKRENNYLITEKYKKQKEFWIEKMAGAEPLILQGDYPVKQKTGKGKEKRFEIASDLVEVIHRLAMNQEITDFMFFLASFSVLMSRYLESSEVLLSSPFSYRPSFEFEETIGCFIRMLPLRFKIEKNMDFAAVLKKVANELVGAFKNIEYPGNLIVRDNLSLITGSASSVFDVTYVYDIYEEVCEDNTKARLVDQDIVTFPGSLMVVLNKTPDKHWIKFQYKPDMFTDETIELFGLRYLKLLEEVVKNINIKIEDIDLFLGDEKKCVLDTFNQSDFFSVQTDTVIDMFTEKAKNNPNWIALIQGEKKLTYAEIYQKVNYLAHEILKLKRNANERVGIQLERSVDLVIATLAVLKAGCAYVSIDPTYPKIRKEFILKDAEISILITSRNLFCQYESDIQYLFVEETIHVSTNKIKDIKEKSDPFSLAYIAYTSGSTGHPKGVMIENRSVVNTLADLERRFPVKKGDVFLFKTSYSFDISVTELFGWFMGEGSLFILEPGAEKNPQQILDLIEKKGITHVNFSPSVFRIFLDLFHNKSNCAKLKNLKWIFIGGESLPVDILQKFKTLGTCVQLENMYGPTECTLWATHHPIRDFSMNKSTVSIGQPLNQTRCYVLDKSDKLQPIGMPGELCLSGIGLARGYANLENVTREKFVANPFFKKGVDPEHYQKIYRTGDLVRWLPSGNLEFLRRIDFQIKIRGMRLELEEIENVLATYEGVIQAVVVSKNKENTFLCAYYLSEHEIPEPKLREHLAGVLPGFMIPSFFIYKKEWPLSNSGKVNRKALIADTDYQKKSIPLSSDCLPKTDLENKIAETWKDVLGISQVGLDDNFFELGGHSLSLIQLNSKLQKVLNVVFPLNLNFQLPTIRLIAEHFSKNSEKSTHDRKSLFKSKKEKQHSDVAIIGMSINVPGADNVHEFWDNLKQEKETLYFYKDEELIEKGIPREILDASNYVKANGQIQGIHHFDVDFFGYTPADIRLMSPQLRLLHRGVWEAFEDAGYFPNSNEKNIGLFLGGSDEFDWYRKTLFPDNFSDKYQAFTLSSNHFLATRLAYNLDIKGPVYSAFTACSTTLVITHLACQSLILAECDLAVAGGITIELPNEAGYFYEPGLMFSPDGHCRPFDAKAAGTVFSNGMGLVVLKRLDEALSDGDHIYAVIKGSAINNDGRQKLGFTSPSVKGQAEAIQQAYRNATIDPETVSYVEAHGTGTLLGDPVEIESLTQAFSTSKKQFCMLGSIKGNVGHTDTASGVVSLAKVALSLKHRYIPGTVNYQKPNPQIELEKTPFIIQAKGMEWENHHDVLLRAGINSFGVGGSNAHAVLEEAPAFKSSDSAAKTNLFVFSAKSPTSLYDTTKKILEFLQKNPQINLSDAAWTLQVGRKPFAYRKCLVIDESFFQECKETFPRKINQAFSYKVQSQNKPVYFMFSGQGSQYIGMGRDFYNSKESGISSIFKRHVDKIFSLLPKKEKSSFWKIMYEEDSDKINETEFSQFALFAIGYALAKTCIELGIKPDGMIGHSIGEITAATIAGVFDLNDAVMIVKERGRLMQRQERGAMLAVMQDAEIVSRELGSDVWLALDNTTGRCVVGGAKKAIELFSEKAKNLNWKTATIKTSHAFHTPMMKNAAEEFQEFISAYKINEPKIPLISNLTGKWVSKKEICLPKYWSEHILKTVNFSKGLAEILKAESGVFIELGAGNVLCALAMQHTSRTEQHHFVNLLRHQKEIADDVEYILKKIGQMWSLGLDIDWYAFKNNSVRHRVSLPTYVFDKIDFPIDINISFEKSIEDKSVSHATADSSLAFVESRDPFVQSEVEPLVIEAYKSVLGFEKIDANQDFFSLGGDSLKAVSLVSYINQNLKIKIDIKDVFQYSSPQALAENLNKDPQLTREELLIKPTEDKPCYPLSSAQNRIYTLYLLDKNNTAYNLPSATLIKGKLDKLIFEDTLKKLVKRHEILRTTFDVRGNQIVQIVHKDGTIPMRYFEHEASSEKEINSLIYAFIKPFDLHKGPLLRSELIKISEESYIFLFDIHHIISDGTSMEVFTRDFNHLYRSEVPPLNIQYRDFSIWQNAYLTSEAIKSHKDFWLKYLSNELPILNFPTDFERYTVKNFEGARVYFRLDPNLTEKAIAFSKENEITLFMMFLSLWNVFLARYANQEEIIVGVPSAGRTRKEIEETMGMFVNMLPIRSAPVGNKKITNFLSEVKENVLNVFKHQDYQFDDIVRQLNIRRDLSRNAVFDVCFDFQNMQFYDFEVEGLEFTPYQFETKSATYDLLLTLQQNKKTNSIEGFIEYSTGLFKRETAERLVENFRTLVSFVIENHEALIEHIDIISEKEKQLIVNNFNDTDLLMSDVPLISTLFEENAKGFPDKIALVLSSGKEIAYRELNEKANILAWRLIELGVKREEIVPIIVGRDETLLTALLAVLKSGAAYLLIDPSLPRERISQMLVQCDVNLVISSLAHKNKFDFDGLILEVDPDDLSESILIKKHDNPNIPGVNTDLACVIFTSGSTGQPKGVLINHGSILNFIGDIKNREIFATLDDRTISLTTVAFDIFGFETLVPLCIGRSVYLASENEQLDSTLIAQRIVEQKVTHIVSTVSRIQVFTESPGFLPALKQLKCIVSGGENFPDSLLSDLKKKTQAKIYNMYGPTETTIWSTTKELTQTNVVNIGRPIANTQTYIINNVGKLQPIGVFGELCIGGAGVARGYLGNSEENNKKFIDLHDFSNLKFYKTGDRARFLSNADLEFKGRLDTQIKIRGYRVELSEIEQIFLKHPMIAQAAALTFDDKNNIKQLVLYYSVKKGAPSNPDHNALRDWLKEKVPPYMLPAFFVFLDKMPVLPNGKIDKKSLKLPLLDQSYSAGASKLSFSLSDMERKLLSLWQEVLNVTTITVKDNFFDLGGNSLGLIQLNNKLNVELGYSIPLLQLFEHPTIESFIKSLKFNDINKAPPQRKTEEVKSTDIAVIGLSCKFPGADNIDEFWKNIVSGVELLTQFQDEELLQSGIPKELFENPNYIKTKGFLKDVEFFDSKFFAYSNQEADIMDPQIRILHQGVWSVLENAGYDPSGYAGKIGLFAGSSSNILWVAQWIKDPHDLLNSYEAISLNEKDFHTTRLSYKLNLKGPSYNIQTACSTSLVAIHQAVQSLLNNEAEMAVAGGVSISYPQKEGYLWHEGMILSRDGHCRPFSENASGIIPGNGCGLVLLKPLSDALRDNDHIYAVIKGSAVNNDGAEKIGYTAPSIAGQREVIEAALKKSGIVPEEISYLEAHGTGTKMGDPLEIEALKRAWHTQKKNFCALGSVKANVGHLDAAAGVASFIKSVLLIYHRTIPPLVNFETPNPLINFEDSPFYINKKAKLVDDPNIILRAGVSSFGIGGTNAHVLLEQSPFKFENKRIQGINLLPFSAKTPEALLETSKEILNYLKNNPSINLLDAAWTLQVGRKAFEYRKVLVFHGNLNDDKNDCIDFLKNPGRKILDIRSSKIKKELAERFTNLLSKKNELDPIDFNKQLGELWCEGLEINWSDLEGHKENRRRVPLPTYVFKKEYHKHDIVLNSIEFQKNYQTNFKQSTHVNLKEKINEDLSIIWRELFGSDICSEDDFFALGGDSLKAVVLTSQVEKVINIKLSIEEVFTYSSFKNMVDFLTSKSDSEKLTFSEIPSIENKEYYEVSSSQKRLYFVHQLLENSLPYNLAAIHLVEGPLDREKFIKSVEALVQRHEAFRTRFSMLNGEVIQVIEKEISFAVEFEFSTESEVENKIKSSIRPFDLSKAPLFRVKLISINSEKQVLLIDMHHIIADQTSISIFVRELAELYAGNTLPPLPIQYKEFSAWQNNMFLSEDFKNQMKYWKNELKGELPLLDISTDFPRPQIQSFAGNRITWEFEEKLSSQINEFSQRQGITPYMLFMSALTLTLWKYTAQEDLIVGTGVAGRQHADLDNVVGMFVNTLPIRVKIDENLTVESYLQYIKGKTINAYENQNCQLEVLIEELNVKKDLSRNPLFDVVLNYINMGNNDLSLEEISIKPWFDAEVYSKFDFTWTIEKKANHYYTDIEFSTALFKYETIQAFLKSLSRTLSFLIKTPQLKLKDLCLLAASEKKQILYELNQTETPYPKNKTIVQIFEEQVENRQHHPALIFRDQEISYLQFNAEANKISELLLACGFGAQDKVAILLDRSPLQMACIFGVLKSGATYVPIDPEYPLERIHFILKDSGSQALLTRSGLCPSALKTSTQVIFLDQDNNIDLRHTVENNSLSPVSPEDTAYIMYTSGSTGTPKGVLTTHRNVIYAVKETNFVRVQPEDRLLQISNYVFDGSTFDIFGAFLNGACLVLVEKEIALEMSLLSNLIEEKNITLFYIPTALFNMLVDWGMDCLKKVRKIIFGGEAASVLHVQKAFDFLGPNRLVNGYGPTEATFFACYYPINQKDLDLSSIPIGYPMSNAKLYLLDKQGQPVPENTPAELYIGGEGVSKGYLNQEIMTKEKFLDNPFEKTGKIYRTGDIVKRLSSDIIVYLRRTDFQVKISGFRIELAEIEYLIKSIPGVKNAIVSAKKDKHNTSSIIAYYTLDQDNNPLHPDQVNFYLKKRIPNYMIPSEIKMIKSFPLTANGKIDLKNLLSMEEIRELPNTNTSINEKEATILQVMKEVLDRPSIGIKDDFFRSGGSSIRAITLVHALSKLGIKVKVTEIFQYPTAEKLAEILSLKNVDEPSTIETSTHSVMLNDLQVNSLVAHASSLCHLLSQLIHSASPLSSFSLAPVQMFYFMKGFSLSGLTTRVSGEVDELEMRKLFTRIIQKNQLLHCIIEEENIPVWKEFDILPIIPLIEKNLVYFDLRAYEKSTQENMVNKLSEFILSSDYQKDTLSWRLCCLRLSQDEHFIIWGFSHISFDAISSEIIRSQIEREVSLICRKNNSADLSLKNEKIIRKYEYYVSQLKKGPSNLNERQIINEFSLQQWAKNNQLLMEKLSRISNKKNSQGIIRIPLTEVNVEDLWSLAFDVAVKSVKSYLEINDVSFGMLSFGRRYGDKEYYNSVGEFIDVIPFFFEEREEKNKIFSQLNLCQEQSINFMSLLFDSSLQKEFPTINKLLLPYFKGDDKFSNFILFNFQGYISKEERMVFEHAIKNKSEKPMSKLSITASYDQDYLTVDIECPEGINEDKMKKIIHFHENEYKKAYVKSMEES